MISVFESKTDPAMHSQQWTQIQACAAPNFVVNKRPHEELTSSVQSSSLSSFRDNHSQQSYSYVDNNNFQITNHHHQTYQQPLPLSLPASSRNQNRNITSDSAKKVKYDFKMTHYNNTSPPLPNNFIAIRNLPLDASDKDINQLLTMVTCNPSTVLAMVICKIKNQAIVEIIDETTALAIVNYFQHNSAQILGQNITVQISNQQEFLGAQQQQQQPSPIPQPSQQHKPQVYQSQLLQLSPSEAPVTIKTSNCDDSSNTNSNNNSTVLRVIIENMLYPITIDILYVLFQAHGKVLKIVTFIKNGVFQALIQYADPANAKKAKAVLDGQNIYNNCCTLRIEYSKMAMLKVRYNNEKSRDYTNTSLPAYDFIDTTNGTVSNLALLPATPEQAAVAAVNATPMGGFVTGAPFATAIPGTTPNDFLLLANQARLPRSAYPFPTTPTDSSVILAALAAAANPSSNPFMATPITSTQYAAAIAAANNALGSLAFASTPHLTTANPVLTTLSNSAFLKPTQAIGTCLHVSNLNEQMVTPDALFTLFGVYGDVLRVKILYNKKDSALVQMAEMQQAQLAIMHMDKLRVFGKNIKVTLSKHQTVQMPKEGQPDAGLTKDYTQSPLHRFKKPGSKNYSNIYPPSATLHLSNIPASVTEETLREYFTKNGFVVKAFKFFPKDNKMALIQLSTLEEAVMALIKMHNYQLSESNHLRVSFSKSSI